MIDVRSLTRRLRCSDRRSNLGAVAVQVVTRRGRVVEQIEHLGSAHTDAELALLLASAKELVSPGQEAMDLGALPAKAARIEDVADWTRPPAEPEPELEPEMDPEPARPPVVATGGRPTSITAGGRVVGTPALVLWTILGNVYAGLGFDVLDDEGFRAMVLARIVEPTSKADVVRVLDEIGAPPVSLRTLFRSLARTQKRDYRGRLATAAARNSARSTGTVALVLYDVTTLHFECRTRTNSARSG